MMPFIWAMGTFPWVIEYILTLPSEWPEKTTGSTVFAVTHLTLFPQLIESKFTAFYIYQIFICLSSEPLTHFYLALDQVTELIFYPCPTKECRFFPVTEL